jgi:excisionase family DNA binding protein
MRKSTEGAIRTLLRMDTTVTSEERMRIIEAMQERDRFDPARDMSVADAAEYLGMCRTTLWRWCAIGKVACDRRGKKFYVKASAVQALKKEVE